MNGLIDEPFNLEGECNKQWNVKIGLYKDTVNNNAIDHARPSVFYENNSWLSCYWLVIDLFTVYDAILARGANTAKITVNVWDFGPLGTRYNAATKKRISNICHFLK